MLLCCTVLSSHKVASTPESMTNRNSSTCYLLTCKASHTSHDTAPARCRYCTGYSVQVQQYSCKCVTCGCVSYYSSPSFKGIRAMHHKNLQIATRHAHSTSLTIDAIPHTVHVTADTRTHPHGHTHKQDYSWARTQTMQPRAEIQFQWNPHYISHGA